MTNPQHRANRPDDLLGFGIILAFRQAYVIAGACLVLNAVLLIILWLLYSGRLVPHDLNELVNLRHQRVIKHPISP